MSTIHQYVYTVHGESFEDGLLVSSCWGEEDKEWLAEDCAKNYHQHHDGWESSWPITIIVYRLDGTKLGTFDVDRDVEPVFSAWEKKR